VVPWEASLHPAYARFAAASFGARAFQARRELIEWLMVRGGDALLAVAPDNDEVVGCVHRMRMPWTSGDDSLEVAALVNLMVAPAHRTGTGLRLFAAGFGRERQAFVPAASDVTAEMCGRLGWCAVPARWYRRAIRPGLPQLAAAIDGVVRGGRTFSPALVARLRPPPGYLLDPAPAAELLGAVAATLRRAPPGTLRPSWDADLVRWRFFSVGAGPRHLLLGRPPWDELAILSLGPRRRLVVGRIVEIRAPTPASLGALAAAATTVLARAGAHMVTLVTSDPTIQERLEAAGWRGPAAPPKMFFFNKGSKQSGQRFCVGGGAGDFGLEAFVAG
jgi:hypothetical protein